MPYLIRNVPFSFDLPCCRITDGPYLETKEHVGGFWVLKAADLDEALAWGRKAAVACRAPVEVRPIN
jgi:hypothetical protein